MSMGKKYIVEIGRLERLYKAFVNEHGKPNITWLSPEVDLTPYTEPDLGLLAKENFERGYRQRKAEYEKEIEETWKYAKKIAVNPVHGGYTIEELDSIFGTRVLSDVFNLSASEAIEKIKAYEQKQEEIQVGDEVKWNGDESDAMFVVTHISEDGYISGINSEEMRYDRRNPENWTKTGRRFPELAEILAKMKEES